MKINGSWTRDLVKEEAFDQDDQSGRHTLWVEVGTKYPLAYPIRNNVLEIRMPSTIQSLQHWSKRCISQRTKNKFAQHNEYLRLCLEAIVRRQKHGTDLAEWRCIIHLEDGSRDRAELVQQMINKLLE